MTLTTETVKLWRRNAEITADETDEHDTEHIAAKAILALTAEILANREAQPVVDECDPDAYRNGKSACLVAIPKETAEVICRGISEATGCKVDWHYIGGRVHIKALTPPAPAVPEEMTKEDAMGFVRERPPFKGPVECVQTTWNACRAAMLAAAPEGGNG
ncbi:hypothetical protein [Serratia grimesii]|uniref:hypothetical protein n=1 Tax=Serratia grimesii TaxID=82995 RepID=UPI00217A3C30|nr:hypothetical protein [Serratia grimesii]CAI0754793.1 Uncharacterised protein [Serratia grimesii]